MSKMPIIIGGQAAKILPLFDIGIPAMSLSKYISIPTSNCPHRFLAEQHLAYFTSQKEKYQERIDQYFSVDYQSFFAVMDHLKVPSTFWTYFFNLVKQKKPEMLAGFLKWKMAMLSPSARSSEGFSEEELQYIRQFDLTKYLTREEIRKIPEEYQLLATQILGIVAEQESETPKRSKYFDYLVVGGVLNAFVRGTWATCLITAISGEFEPKVTIVVGGVPGFLGQIHDLNDFGDVELFAPFTGAVYKKGPWNGLGAAREIRFSSAYFTETKSTQPFGTLPVNSL
eukprot:TRINITY_DN3720_c0_g1_i3.p1 TRINITY_DN3720_c0_g1~~TRINITY_DN3720_c0_g1_i3.p1  ORF type:complete len:284 (+),score=52.41 TRINITY_DN3720_c0_g1_i3:90-941(+)